MRVLLLLFVLSEPIFINACLKIQLLPPPPCACPVVAIKPAELRLEYAMWYDAPFWGGVPETLLRQPILNVDDCYAQMSCEGVLFIFDKGPDRNFGAYSAEGFCDPYTQTWSVTDPNNEFITINLLYGICRLSTDHCSCGSLALQPSNIWQMIPPGQPYFKKVTLNTIKAPVISVSNERCDMSMYCEGDYNLLVFDPVAGKSAHTFGKFSADGFCDASTQTWSIDDGSGQLETFNQMNGVCVKNSKCKCGSPELNNENAQFYIGNDGKYKDVYRHHPIYPANVTLSADGCQHKRYCSEGLTIIVYTTNFSSGNREAGKEFSFSTGSKCTPQSTYFDWELQEGPTIYQTDFVAPICVDFSKTIG